ncbi:hypothetical protein BS17DRAFT_266036 [Gyrodon lividus]|nr:hypothetical protein BS17DRAFT_266036 [Gyrodon lividus]
MCAVVEPKWLQYECGHFAIRDGLPWWMYCVHSPLHETPCPNCQETCEQQMFTSSNIIMSGGIGSCRYSSGRASEAPCTSTNTERVPSWGFSHYTSQLLFFCDPVHIMIYYHTSPEHLLSHWHHNIFQRILSHATGTITSYSTVHHHRHYNSMRDHVTSLSSLVMIPRFGSHPLYFSSSHYRHPYQ